MFSNVQLGLSYKYILVFIVQALGQRISKRAKKQNPDLKKGTPTHGSIRIAASKILFPSNR
jgi:hypothetical protein